jgi:hypothetical protein
VGLIVAMEDSVCTDTVFDLVMNKIEEEIAWLYDVYYQKVDQ